MDKREQKSLDAIYNAFRKVISEKDYESITIQDIIDNANISRSTFYAHFKQKDDVLDGICVSIFDHVFSTSLHKEKDHDFSNSSIFDYKHLITHIFYHFLDEKYLIHAILSSQGKNLFIKNLREKIQGLSEACVSSKLLYKDEVPENLQVYQLTESFIGLLTYFVMVDENISPEQMTEYLFKLYA
jgi:AcrR family transcriptional regulator